MINLALFFGGKSVEHDISIITALQTMNGLGKEYNLIPIYINSNGKMINAKNLKDEKIYLNFNKNAIKPCDVVIPSGLSEIWLVKNGKIKKRQKIDCALLCCHGHGGEDGCLQGMLELAEIPYTSCSPLSSALCMDKVSCKIHLMNAQVITPSYVDFDLCSYQTNSQEILEKIEKELSFPCIVKPANLGSSVGINICENVDELKCAIAQALEFDKKIIVEKFIDNAREFCCAIIKSAGNLIASNVSEVKKGKFFTFEEKYLSKKEDEKREITKTLEKNIKDMAKRAYKTLECDGVVRVDFLYDGKKLYVNELNSIPGSLSFSMFNTAHGDLLNVLIQEAIKRKEEKGDIIYQFNSQAIENYIEMKRNIKK